MAGYIGTRASVVTPGAERKKVFSISTTTSSLTGLEYTPGFVHVFHNGVRLVDGTDYTGTNGTSITLTTAAQNGDEVVVISYATFQVADAYTKAESDARFVDVTGDTMTGALGIGSSASNRLALTYDQVSGLATVGPNSTGGSTTLSLGTSLSGSYAERMRITSTGNVGIGTTSPNQTLVVKTADGGGIAIENSAGNQYRWAVNADDSFSVVDSGTAERLRIDSSGNLLVGGTTVESGYGGIPVLSVGANSNGLITVRRSSTAAASQIIFYNPNGIVGQILTDGSSTTFATSSDYRLKENVQPMVGATDRLMALKPVNFAWKVDGSRVDGFLAHEAQEVVPECVTGQKDQVQIVEIKDEDGNVTGTEERPVYQGIDQSKIVPLLTAALQEALTKIEQLEARMAILEGGAA